MYCQIDSVNYETNQPTLKSGQPDNATGIKDELNQVSSTSESWIMVDSSSMVILYFASIFFFADYKNEEYVD